MTHSEVLFLELFRGARTVRINPTGSDTYETVLEIDQDMVAYLFRQAQTL